MLEAGKRGRNHRYVQPGGGNDSFIALHDLLSAAGTTPSQGVARGEARTALEQAILQLPEIYQQVVRMYDLEGRPVEEVARALNRSPGAIYMVRARAHRRLCELMGRSSKYFSTV